jgi:hypothetical protein
MTPQHHIAGSVPLTAVARDGVQEVEYVKEEAKLVYLLECLQKTAPPVLVFAENKKDVDAIHEYLLIKVLWYCTVLWYCGSVVLWLAVHRADQHAFIWGRMALVGAGSSGVVLWYCCMLVIRCVLPLGSTLALQCVGACCCAVLAQCSQGAGPSATGNRGSGDGHNWDRVAHGVEAVAGVRGEAWETASTCATCDFCY